MSQYSEVRGRLEASNYYQANSSRFNLFDSAGFYIILLLRYPRVVGQSQPSKPGKLGCK